MIGLDTNVLVRYIMQDDARQSALATRLIESMTAEAPGFVPLVAVLELTWVLSSAFGLNRSQIVLVFETMLQTRELVIERADMVGNALKVFGGSKADFADCLIERSASAAGCDRTMTFDRGAAKGCGMTLVPT